jgi:4a-hydroxytetrahydrobiopterin dehydratase
MLISPDEIKKSVSKKGWEYSNKKIAKSFDFSSYNDKIKFVNNIADLAESLNHHPIITINPSNVKIEIYSIQFNGITTKCINLAMKIDAIYNTN